MSSSLVADFVQLSDILSHTQQFWKPVAFHNSSNDWTKQVPEVAHILLALSADEIERFHFEPSRLLDILTHTVPQLTELYRLSHLPAAQTKELAKVNPRFYAGMPGRKWQQVQALCACVHISQPHVLEYCAGKSHLGFYIAQSHKLPVIALEWEKALVEQSNSRAKAQQRDLVSHQVDVMSQACDDFFNSQQHVLALHACGALHERFLELSLNNQVAQLTLVPCCYHKRSQDHYVPYSALGKQHDLRLNKNDLHTAVMETVTAGATVVKQRKTLQTMRLGFDLLQRDLLATESYLPLPSMPISFSRLDFDAFCRHWANEKQLNLPPSINWSYYLQQAQQRFHEVSAFDLIRAVFRRPLEVWLNMDKAIWLQDHQYEVSLSTFCDREISPRNIVLQANR